MWPARLSALAISVVSFSALYATFLLSPFHSHFAYDAILSPVLDVANIASVIVFAFVALSGAFALAISFGVEVRYQGEYKYKPTTYGQFCDSIAGDSKTLCGAGALCTVYLVVLAILFCFVVTAIIKWGASDWLFLVLALLAIVGVISVITGIGHLHSKGHDKTVAGILVTMVGTLVVAFGLILWLIGPSLQQCLVVGACGATVALIVGAVWGVKKALELMPHHEVICPVENNTYRTSYWMDGI